MIFASADYDGLELRTGAQACLTLLGHSRLAGALNAGQDPHLIMAGNMLGTSYEEAVARAKQEKRDRSAAREANPSDPSGAARRVPAPFDDGRQAGKVANFGFPGGLGAEKLCLFARKTYKVMLDIPRAKWLKGVWLETFPEWRDYFRLIDSWQGPDGLITVRHIFSGRVQGGCTYTEACNAMFQGLGATATGAACFEISEACYARPESPLFGARMVNFPHDEFILECEENSGHETAHELVRVMSSAAAPYLPGVPATAKPVLMRYWSKDAEQVWENGRLMPWPKA